MKKLFLLFFYLIIYNFGKAQNATSYLLEKQDVKTTPTYQIGINTYQLTESRTTFFAPQLSAQLYGKFLQNNKAWRFSLGYEERKELIDIARFSEKVFYKGIRLSAGMEKKWDLGRFQPFTFMDLVFRKGNDEQELWVSGFTLTHSFSYKKLNSLSIVLGTGFDFKITQSLGISFATGYEFSRSWFQTTTYTRFPLSLNPNVFEQDSYSDKNFDGQLFLVQQLGVFWSF